MIYSKKIGVTAIFFVMLALPVAMQSDLPLMAKTSLICIAKCTRLNVHKNYINCIITCRILAMVC